MKNLPTFLPKMTFDAQLNHNSFIQIEIRSHNFKTKFGDICDSLDDDIILAVMDFFQSCLCYMGYRTTDYCFQTWLFL